MPPTPTSSSSISQADSSSLLDVPDSSDDESFSLTQTSATSSSSSSSSSRREKRPRSVFGSGNRKSPRNSARKITRRSSPRSESEFAVARDGRSRSGEPILSSLPETPPPAANSEQRRRSGEPPMIDEMFLTQGEDDERRYSSVSTSSRGSSASSSLDPRTRNHFPLLDTSSPESAPRVPRTSSRSRDVANALRGTHRGPLNVSRSLFSSNEQSDESVDTPMVSEAKTEPIDLPPGTSPGARGGSHSASADTSSHQTRSHTAGPSSTSHNRSTADTRQQSFISPSKSKTHEHLPRTHSSWPLSCSPLTDKAIGGSRSRVSDPTPIGGRAGGRPHHPSSSLPIGGRAGRPRDTTSLPIGGAGRSQHASGDRSRTSSSSIDNRSQHSNGSIGGGRSPFDTDSSSDDDYVPPELMQAKTEPRIDLENSDSDSNEENDGNQNEVTSSPNFDGFSSNSSSPARKSGKKDAENVGLSSKTSPRTLLGFRENLAKENAKRRRNDAPSTTVERESSPDESRRKSRRIQQRQSLPWWDLHNPNYPRPDPMLVDAVCEHVEKPHDGCEVFGISHVGLKVGVLVLWCSVGCFWNPQSHHYFNIYSERHTTNRWY